MNKPFCLLALFLLPLCLFALEGPVGVLPASASGSDGDRLAPLVRQTMERELASKGLALVDSALLDKAAADAGRGPEDFLQHRVAALAGREQGAAAVVTLVCAATPTEVLVLAQLVHCADGSVVQSWTARTPAGLTLFGMLGRWAAEIAQAFAGAPARAALSFMESGGAPANPEQHDLRRSTVDASQIVYREAFSGENTLSRVESQWTIEHRPVRNALDSLPLPSVPPAQQGVPNRILPVRTVEASSHDGNIAQNTIDRNLASRWAGNGKGEWVQWQLSSLCRVARIKIAFNQASPRSYQFDLGFSEDGVTFTTETGFKSNQGSRGFETFEIARSKTRYIRYIGQGNSKDAWNSIAEIEFIGEVLEPPAPGSAASLPSLHSLSRMDNIPALKLTVPQPLHSVVMSRELEQDLVNGAMFVRFQLSDSADLQFILRDKNMAPVIMLTLSSSGTIRHGKVSATRMYGSTEDREFNPAQAHELSISWDSDRFVYTVSIDDYYHTNLPFFSQKRPANLMIGVGAAARDQQSLLLADLLVSRHSSAAVVSQTEAQPLELVSVVLEAPIDGEIFLGDLPLGSLRGGRLVASLPAGIAIPLTLKSTGRADTATMTTVRQEGQRIALQTPRTPWSGAEGIEGLWTGNMSGGYVFRSYPIPDRWFIRPALMIGDTPPDPVSGEYSILVEGEIRAAVCVFDGGVLPIMLYAGAGLGGNLRITPLPRDWLGADLFVTPLVLTAEFRLGGLALGIEAGIRRLTGWGLAPSAPGYASGVGSLFFAASLWRQTE